MMSDCEKCWETPCSCGYDYKDRPIEYLIKMRNMFQNLIDIKNLELKKENYNNYLNDNLKLDYISNDNTKWYLKNKISIDNDYDTKE